VKFSNEMGQQTEVAGRLLEIVDTAGDKESAEIAFVLGEIKARDAVQKLVRLFDSESEAARAQAFIAIGKMRDKNAVSSISEKVAVEKSQWVKIQIAWALEQIKDDSCIPVLINMLADDDDQVKSAALRSLVHITNQARLGEDPQEWIKWWEQRKKGGSR
jgi:HEAT repeat protein